MAVKNEDPPIQIEESSLTDNEGNIYKAVKIGTQIWMAENLKVTKYLNGDIIGTTKPIDKNIENEVSAKYQWPYKDGNETDTITNVSIYGRLYTWFVVIDTRNICPGGWHVPSIEEWHQLSDFLGGNAMAGGKLKETGYTHWWSPNKAATNAYGFAALASGSRSTKGGTGNIGMFGSWWSSSEYDPPTRARSLTMDHEYSSLFFTLAYKNEGNSVRCVKTNN